MGSPMSSAARTLEGAKVEMFLRYILTMSLPCLLQCRWETLSFELQLSHFDLCPASILHKNSIQSSKLKQSNPLFMNWPTSQLAQFTWRTASCYCHIHLMDYLETRLVGALLLHKCLHFETCLPSMIPPSVNNLVSKAQWKFPFWFA